jgi:RNA polymerase sigma-70 factor (ECF subfamily)
MDPLADQTVDLLERYRTGDRAALEALFERHWLRVVRLVRIELGGDVPPGREVEDVVQDVFVRVLEGLEGYEPRTDARWISWVAALARHEIANRHRHARAQKRGGGARAAPIRTESGSFVAAVADSSSIVSRVARNADMERVDACVQRLSPDQREVVLQREYVGADWNDIAQHMQRSVGACQQLHLRARLELARLLAEHGG